MNKILDRFFNQRKVPNITPTPTPVTTSRWAGQEIPTRIFSSPPHEALQSWAEIREGTLTLKANLSPGISDHNNHIAKDKLVLAHAIRPAYYDFTPLGIHNIEHLLYNWDVVSTSLIKLNPSNDNDFHQISDLAVILSVPPQNIIGTLTRDAWFPNGIGAQWQDPENFDSRKLTEAYFFGQHKATQDAAIQRMLQETINGTYSRLLSVDELLQQRNRDIYNEVLVLGKKGVNTYANDRTVRYKPTRYLKVCAIYYRVRAESTEDANRRTSAFLYRITHNNPGIPIIMG
ncbi:hypothetical protein [Enterobacter sp. Bisph1]|uniref:hypothetical protein n=1 Tax=Enterobacter sp. Bisph1 TaxID=1274399 RepID=UPI00057C0B26|nr:hypothetical protein [Enterobacter sp. Bisph1]